MLFTCGFSEYSDPILISSKGFNIILNPSKINLESNKKNILNPWYTRIYYLSHLKRVSRKLTMTKQATRKVTIHKLTMRKLTERNIYVPL